jgi:RimJ/RimL family protein N-acetyltransferase
MSAPENYSATARLRDGRAVEIRALRPDDKDDMLMAVSRTGTQSLQRRFFVVKRGFSEREIAYFMNVDFANHVALVAFADEDGQKVIIGGGRYIVTEPGKAEIAFVVIDDYQGQGIGTLLMRHLAVLARKAELRELIAEVLPENAAMRKVFSKFGFEARRGHDPQVVHLVLTL